MSEKPASTLSIIMPVLNEAAGIAGVLAALSPIWERGAEVIVVDGGSSDRTVEIAAPLASHVIAAKRGRGAQMNAGAAAAKGDILLFLHADTELPPFADRLVIEGLARSRHTWGRFDVRIESEHFLLKIVAFFMNLRSRLTGIMTGDQAIFVTRAAFERAGGYPDLALMEDIAFSTRLKRIGRPLCLREKVVTSCRCWTKNGIVRTIIMMWWLRLSFYLGTNPETLARRYGYAPRE